MRFAIEKGMETEKVHPLRTRRMKLGRHGAPRNWGGSVEVVARTLSSEELGRSRLHPPRLHSLDCLASAHPCWDSASYSHAQPVSYQHHEFRRWAHPSDQHQEEGETLHSRRWTCSSKLQTSPKTSTAFHQLKSRSVLPASS